MVNQLKGGERMDIVKLGTEDINEMASLSCCWPPGSENMQMPEE